MVITMKKMLTLLCVILLGSLTGCTSSDEPYNSEIFVMSTYVTQQVYGKNSELAAKNINNLLNELDNQLSLFIDGSDIDKINKNAGLSPVKVNSYTFDLIKTAKRYSELSQDRFDITIAPLTLLWGIDTKNAHVPKQEELDAALMLVDYNKLILDEENESVMLASGGMALDLGGIAKGYIVNRIKEEYTKQGISSALVSIGGNIFAYGKKPDRSQFTLGIRDPKGSSGNEILGKLSVTDKVVATTGAYERYFEQDGKKYHHILDVNTGYPVDSDLASVTIICEDGGLADYLSTTLFIAGKAHISDYINDERFEVIIVDNEDKVYLSPGLNDSFTLTNDSYTLE